MVITNRSIKKSSKDLVELNEWSWASGSGKQEKQWFPLPFPLSCQPSVSVKEKTDRKIKTVRNKEREKIGIKHKPNWKFLTLDIM